MAKALGARKTGVSVTLSIGLLFKIGKIHEQEPDKSLSAIMETLLEEAVRARTGKVVAA
jgi:hypothetical protein